MCKVKIFGDKYPKIVFSLEAIQSIKFLVETCEKEVSWLGTVSKKDNEYTIQKVYLIEQEVTHVETEMSMDGMTKLYEEHGGDITSLCMFWGHSHVNMGVNPSGTDEKTLREFQSSGFDYMIRGIFNKKGDVSLDMIHFTDGLIWEDIPYSINLPGVKVETNEKATYNWIKNEVTITKSFQVDSAIDCKKLEKEFKEKVKEKKWDIPHLMGGKNPNGDQYPAHDHYKNIWDYDDDIYGGYPKDPLIQNEEGELVHGKKLLPYQRYCYSCDSVVHESFYDDNEEVCMECMKEYDDGIVEI